MREVLTFILWQPTCQNFRPRPSFLIPSGNLPAYFFPTLAMNFSELLTQVGKWPLLQQIRHGVDGTGPESYTDKTRNLHARIDQSREPDVKVSKSICPYCAVGCGQLVYHKDGQPLSIEGDPDSPISQGNLCPKGSASYQLVTQPERVTKVKYRAPYAKEWTELSRDTAIDMIADRLWEARKKGWIKEKDGVPVNHCENIAHLGGATLDNEENYLIKKLFTAGLGMVCVSNQARI